MPPTSTILIVDDEPSMREAMADLLQAEGYHPIVAQNGAEALVRAAEFTPDLILLDVMMPGMDGFAVCRRLRSDPLLAQVPIIMLTSLDDYASRLQGFKAGADDFVSKPFRQIELLARVKTTTQLNRYRLLLQEQTRRQQAEEALRASEERYRSLFDGVPVALCRSTPDGQILDANEALVEMTGYPDRESLLAVNTASLYADPEEHRRLWTLLEREETVRAFETRLGRLDGVIIQIQINARVVRDATGRTLYCEGSLEDITERKRAQDEIKRRNEELAAVNTVAGAVSQSFELKDILAAALETTVVMLSAEGGLVRLYDKSSRTWLLAAHRGLSQRLLRDLVGLEPGGAPDGWAAESGEPELVHELATEEQNPWEAAVNDGWQSLVSVRLKARGGPMGVMTILGRAKAQFASENLEPLTAIGNQIGIAIERAQLAKEASEVEILQELDRLRSELIANVSHELRTPLGLIKICSSSLLAEDVDFDREVQLQFLQGIDEEADRLEEIVDNLLDLSQIESGRLRLNKRPTDLEQLARETVEAMEPQASHYHFIHDFPSQPLVAAVDPKRIEQVLRNLLSNAIKYSPDGGAITVKGCRDKDRVLITVADQGMGIPQWDLEKIFERFYRVEDETAERVRGVGLGLAVCRGTVEAHGGRIWAESTYGEGSTFHLDLPVGGSADSDGGQRER